MSSTVEIPLWLAVLVGVLGLLGLLDRIIGPSLRWFFRKRVNRAIDRLNQRLDLKIQPFKLTKRKVLIDRLIYDPEVMAALEAHVAEEDVPREVAVEKVERYARETVPAFSAFAYFGFGMRLSRWVSQALYRVRIGVYDDKELSAIDPEAAVVFVMNHRSNIDYLLVTYLAARRTSLSYAVGEWANVWGLRQVIRAMGAYFIRRKSRNPLYRKVVARYIKMAVEGGVTQAMFPEGGLSRDGRLGPAKLGLISYMCDGFEPGVSRDIVFVPVGLNYDRVIEDRILLESIAEEKQPRFNAGPFSAIKFVLRLMWMKATGRLYRFGYACVSFGTPLSLTEYAAGGAVDVEALGETLMGRVGAVIPVLPVSLVATVLLNAERALSPLELKAATADLIARLKARGAHLHIPRNDDDYAVDVGLRMMRMRGLVREEPEGLRANPDEERVLRYYANAIAHLI
jgi:glycerol-3-phosphate O-acyltransferase